jgi:transcription initiation factor TFIIIB Brf1 subunit/transcription initiation factor TFIIB
MTSPDQITQHVVDAATVAYRDAKESRSDYEREMSVAIAAALDALMDDEPVMVKHRKINDEFSIIPSDVLAAVLNRKATP